MGDPRWVDWYWDYGRDDLSTIRDSQSGVILVGYSRGGQIIGELSARLDNVVAAIIYESPPPRNVGGNFPVLLIWNRRSRKAKSKQAALTERQWRLGGRRVDRLSGKGRHLKWVRGVPPVGHGWDVTLNPIIEEWIGVCNICGNT